MLQALCVCAVYPALVYVCIVVLISVKRGAPLKGLKGKLSESGDLKLKAVKRKQEEESLRGGSATYTHTCMFICVNCPLGVRLNTQIYFQLYQQFVQTLKSTISIF